MHRLGHNAKGAPVHLLAALRRAFPTVDLCEDVEKALSLQLPFIPFLFLKIVLRKAFQSHFFLDGAQETLPSLRFRKR